MKKLIPMTDFILERSLKDISEYTITEAFKNGAKTMNEIFSYANFLKKPLELKMFVPCDEDGNVLQNPCKNNQHCADFCQGRCQEDFNEAVKELYFTGGFDFKKKTSFEQWIEDNNLSNIESLIGLEIELTDFVVKRVVL